MVFNGIEGDKQPIMVNNVAVVLCEQYVYLGSVITADGSSSTAIKAHAQRVMCQVLKFVTFVEKNNDVPFWIKKKVFTCALMSSILYGCESWLNGDVKPVSKLYMWCVKKLLGVRKTTRNDLCLLEIGCPPLQALVKATQRTFFHKLWRERRDMHNDPLSHAINVTLNSNTSTSRFLFDVIHTNVDDVQESYNSLKTSAISSVSPKVQLYITLNPEFITHPLYTTKTGVNERVRISWSIAIKRHRGGSLEPPRKG